MQRRIAVDLDEVIVDFIPAFLKFFNDRYGRNISFADITSYNLWESGIGETKEEAIKYVLEFCSTDSFTYVPLVRGSKEAINQLAGKYQVNVVTSRTEGLREKTDEFLRRHFPNTPLVVNYASDFYGGNNQTKAQICKALGVDVVIEDNLSYAFDCSKSGLIVYLLNKPWNQGILPENIKRVESWQEIVREL